MKIFVVTAGSALPIGRYTSKISPRVGDRLDANNGQWEVTRVLHDIPGELTNLDLPIPKQTTVVVYAQRTIL